MNNQTLIDRFKSNLVRKQLSQNTVRSFISTIEKLSLKCELISASTFDLEDFVDEMLNSGRKGSTVNQRIACLQSFFKYIQAVGVRQDNPSTAIEHVKLETKDTQFEILDADKYYEIYANKKIDLAIRVAIIISAFTGMRTSEICNLKLEDVDFDNNEILVIGGKGNKTATIFMCDFVKTAILEYVERKKISDGWLIRNKQNEKMTSGNLQCRFKNAKSKAGIPENITIHSGRHFCASSIANGDKTSVTIAMKQLRHSVIKTTLNYVHTTREDMKKINGIW